MSWIGVLVWLGCGPATVAEAPAPPADKQCTTSPYTGCFLPVPAGVYLLGDPPRATTVPGFWIARDELTVGTWQACAGSGACASSEVDADGPLATLPRSRSLPLNGVSWTGATAVCGWLGGRLPTGVEWEAAARGPDGRRWPWGDDPGCGTRNPALPPQIMREGQPPKERDEMLRGPCLHEGPVSKNGLVGASPAGVEGAAGNLWEWTTDPAEIGHHLRGGGWLEDSPELVTVTAKIAAADDAQLPDVGVRCVWGL